MIGVYFSLLLSGATLGAGAQTSEFPAEERALVAATAAFFEAVEDPSATSGHGFFSDTYAAALPLDVWQAQRQADAASHGAVADLTAYRITWYPVDTLLGAVDFVGRDAGGENLVCGYVLWEFAGAGEPRLRLYESTHVATADLARMSDADRATALLEANCAYTDLSENFALSKR